MKTALYVLAAATVLTAQPTVGPASLNAGWLWPKGVYTLVIHDGPGPRTQDIAAFLSARGIVADFFQVLCHYAGQPTPDSRTSMCLQPHVVPVAQLSQLQALHQCVGNHGQDHLSTPTLNQADTVYQIGGPTSFFQEFWPQQDCPALLTFPGFQTDGQHNTWLNQDGATSGRQEGGVWADFDGSGTVMATAMTVQNEQECIAKGLSQQQCAPVMFGGTVTTASGPVTVQNDQDCFAQYFSQEQCVAVMLGAMAQANHGGIVNIHDFNPFSANALDPNDLRSGYAYDYIVAIVNGCQAANNGNPCVWLTPDAIPGVHRNRSVNQFGRVSSSSDDFSDRIADILVGDLNGDSLPDVLVPRSDGIYCAMNAGNGTLYGLQRCLSFPDSSRAAGRYWLVDVDGDNLPYVIWPDSGGLVGAKADGKGGFGSETRLLSASLAENKSHGAIYPESIRFGKTREGSNLPNIVAMSASGIVVATNNGHGFDAPHSIPHLAYQGEANPGWSPEIAGRHMLLVNLFGTGSTDIVIAGHAGLLYAKSDATGFSAFKPLTAADGFNNWTAPQIYTALKATSVGGKIAIAGWTSTGIDLATFKTVGGRPAVEKFQMLCSDCFTSLPGWLDQWQQSNMTAAPFQGGFADLKGTGSPQAFAVWGTGLFAGDVSTLAGYR